MTSTELLDRCIESPEAHLAEPSIDHFNAYETGYSSHGMLVDETCDRTALRQTICADYGIDDWPQNIDHWSIFTALHGPLEGLRRCALYRHRFYRVFTDDSAHQIPSIFELIRSGGLLRERPFMYLGNDVSAQHLWSLFSGLRWAESDAGTNGPGTAFMEGFQCWLAQRFSFARLAPWGRALMFLSLGSSKRSLFHFWEYFDFYEQGESPDCPSAAARTMITSITQKFGLPSEELVDQIVHKIAPI